MTAVSNVLNPAVPPINRLMQLAATRIVTAIDILTEQGFVVIGIDFSNGARPTIQVQSCSACAGLIESGEATYYRVSGAGADRSRTGQFKIGEVRVIWIERGN